MQSRVRCRKPKTFTDADAKGKSPENEQATNLVDLEVSSSEYTLLSATVDEKHEKKYFQVLEQFQHGYPKLTDVACWWCCHQFDTEPIGVPSRFDQQNKQFTVVGCFCSYNCARTFVETEKRSECKWMLVRMYKELTGKSVTQQQFDEQIPPASPRFTLKMFGGKLSIQEYRATFTSGTTYRECFLPMMPWGMFYDEMNKKQTVVVNGIRKTLEIRKAKPTRDYEDDITNDLLESAGNKSEVARHNITTIDISTLGVTNPKPRTKRKSRNQASEQGLG